MDVPHEVLILLLFCAAFIAFGGWLVIRSGSAARLIQDTPTSRIRSAAQGYVELHGRLEKVTDDPVLSPLTKTECVWWRYKIEKRIDQKDRSDWRLVEGRSSQVWLRLNDGTGVCLINSVGASISAGVKDVWEGYERYPTGKKKGVLGKLFSSKYRYTEERLYQGQDIYAIGDFLTQRADQSFDLEAEQANILAQWQADQQALLARFDRNGDGTLDEREWQWIHAQANDSALRHLRMRAAEGPVNVMCKPQDSRPFEISGKGKRSIVRGHYITVAVGVVLFTIGLAGIVTLLY